MRWGLVALCALYLASVAHAESANEFLNGQKDPEQKLARLLLLKGVVAGLTWYNGALAYQHEHEGKPDARLFCLPPKLALTPEQANYMIVSYVQKKPWSGVFDFEQVMIEA